MTQARFELDPYSVRVLDVIKGKFGLKNRNDALKRLIEEHGENYAEMNIDEKILQELDTTIEDHRKNHEQRKMSLQELETLMGLQ